MKVEEILESIKKLSAIELAELVEGLKTAFGIDDSMLTVSAGSGSGNAEAADADASSSTVKVVLEAIDDGKKMDLIKAIKTVLNIGLAEAKAMVDGVANGEVIIKSGLSRPDATALVAQFDGTNAKIAIK